VAITRVQTATGVGTTGTTSPSISWPAPTTAGNFLVAACGLAIVGNPTATVTLPSPWFEAVNVRNPTFNSVVIWVINNASSRSGAETFTLSLVGDTCLFLFEYSGITDATALDRTASTTGTGTQPASGTTATTTEADELLISVLANRADSTQSSPTNSFTQIATAQGTNGTITNRVNAHVYERIVSATGAYDMQATLGTSRPWSGGIATFIGEPAAQGVWTYGWDVKIG
jgi:hypothetical protein